VLANKESASTRSAISVVAYQLSSQLPVYEDRLNSSPLDKTVVETNLSTVFDRLFAEPLKDPVPIADKPQAILIDALDEATRNGSNELAWLIGGELQRMPRGCAKIPLSFEVDRYNGQPANNRLNVSVKRDALDLGTSGCLARVCFVSWGLQRYSYRHEVPQDLAAAVSGNPQDQKAVRRGERAELSSR
jgi:hypothetical protein